MKAGIFGVVLVALAIAGCEAPTRFEATISKPIWFYSVPARELDTSAEVSALWQSEKRCCGDDTEVLGNNRIFYKSCYNAIADHYQDEELVVKCLWLMGAGSGMDQGEELARFLVDNFGHHKNRVDDCVNCMPADTVGSATLDLARYESDASPNRERSIGRIENLLDTREAEISYWLQAEIYEYLGQLYLETGVTQQRWDRYKRAYGKLNSLKDSDEPLKRRFAPLEKNHDAMSKIAEPGDVENAG